MAMLAGALAVSTNPLWAAAQDRTKDKIQAQTKDQERIYGSELMTEKERNEYRQRMRSAKTEQRGRRSAQSTTIACLRAPRNGA